VLALALEACGSSQEPKAEVPKSDAPIRERAAKAWGEAPVATPASSLPGTPAPAPVPPVLAIQQSLKPCDAEHSPWAVATPHGDEESAFGVGRGATLEEAVERGRTEAAKSIEVHISASLEDTQVDWQQSSGATSREQYESKIKAVSQSSTTRRLSECHQTEACQESAKRVAALIACARRGALEREIAKTAKSLATEIPAKSTLLFIPGTDTTGWITGFGEYLMQMVRGELSLTAPKDASLLKLPSWTPTDLRELARKSGVTGFVRLEHTDAGRGRQRVSVWLQDASNDKSLSAIMSFDTDLDADQLGLLAVRGPLLPQKGAMDLASDLGDRRVTLKLNKTSLAEGDHVEVEVVVTEPSYVYLFDLYEDGGVAALFPDPTSPSNFVAPGTRLRIPDENWMKSGKVLVACPIHGQKRTRETIKAIASASPLKLPGTSASGSGQVSAEEIVAKLSELRRAGVRFADASAPYEILAKSSAKSPCQ
jgi:hypothetical protein